MVDLADKRAILIRAASGLGRVLAEPLTASRNGVNRIVPKVLSKQRLR